MKPLFAASLLGGQLWVGALTVLVALGQAPPSLTVAAAPHALLVSFELNPSTWDDIDTGLDACMHVNVAYDVDLRRSVRFWLDPAVDRSTVRLRAECTDNQGMYAVSRRVTGQPSHIFDAADRRRARALLTTFSDLPLFDSQRLEPGTTYEIRVRASFMRSDGLTVSTPRLSQRRFRYRPGVGPHPLLIHPVTPCRPGGQSVHAE